MSSAGETITDSLPGHAQLLGDLALGDVVAQHFDFQLEQIDGVEILSFRHVLSTLSAWQWQREDTTFVLSCQVKNEPSDLVDTKQEIGQRLRSFGKGNYVSLVEFADALEISAQQLNSYLSGNRIPGNKMQERLRKLGCDLTWLITGQTKEELDKASESFFIRKARELMPDKFKTLDYLESIGLDTPEKVKRVCDPQGIAEDVAMVMRERLVKYQVKKRRKR